SYHCPVTAEGQIVTVEYQRIFSWFRHAYTVVRSRDGLKINDHKQRISRFLALAQVANHTLSGIMRVDPLVAVEGMIQFPQRLLLQKQLVQVSLVFKHAPMRIIIQ